MAWQLTGRKFRGISQDRAFVEVVRDALIDVTTMKVKPHKGSEMRNGVRNDERNGDSLPRSNHICCRLGRDRIMPSSAHLIHFHVRAYKAAIPSQNCLGISVPFIVAFAVPYAFAFVVPPVCHGRNLHMSSVHS